MHNLHARSTATPGELTYHPEELATKLNVSRQTVYKGLRAGTIPAIRLGKRFVIPRAAIEKWLENGGAAA
jgi:excisionase family DNA binding protein